MACAINTSSGVPSSLASISHEVRSRDGPMHAKSLASSLASASTSEGSAATSVAIRLPSMPVRSQSAFAYPPPRFKRPPSVRTRSRSDASNSVINVVASRWLGSTASGGNL